MTGRRQRRRAGLFLGLKAMRTDEMMKCTLRWACALALLTIAAPMVSAQALLTVAGSSAYKATSKHAQVVEYCERLVACGPFGGTLSLLMLIWS